MKSVILALTLVLFSGLASAQDSSSTVPSFHHQLFNLTSKLPGYGRLLVSIEVPYDSLHLIESEGLYHGSFTLEITVTDSTGRRVAGEAFDKQVAHRADGDQSLIQHFAVDYDLPPATYWVEIALNDRNGHRPAIVKSNKALRALSNSASFELSDMLFINQKLSRAAGRLEISPTSFDYCTAPGREFYAYLELVQHEEQLPFDVRLVIRNRRQQTIIDQKRSWPIYRNPATLILPIWTELLPYGLYEAEIEITQGEQSKRVTRPFRVAWGGMPQTAIHLTQLLEWSLLIADRIAAPDLQSAIDDATIAEKQQALSNFWRNRNAAYPETWESQLAEFHLRIERAEETFGAVKEGWKTDIGKVYVQYGPPDRIDLLDGGTPDTPTQIWHYYDAGRQFTFIDRFGMGEYALAGAFWQQ